MSTNYPSIRNGDPKSVGSIREENDNTNEQDQHEDKEIINIGMSFPGIQMDLGMSVVRSYQKHLLFPFDQECCYFYFWRLLHLNLLSDPLSWQLLSLIIILVKASVYFN